MKFADHQRVNPDHMCTSNIADYFRYYCDGSLKPKEESRFKRSSSDSNIKEDQRNSGPPARWRELSPVEEEVTSTTSKESENNHLTPGNESLDQENKSTKVVEKHPHWNLNY